MNTRIKITVGNHTMTAILENNESARALTELIGNEPYTVSGHNYGDFEKVCSLGTRIKANDTYINTKPGDIVLYQGNKICFYYDTNSWEFTMLGHVEDLSDAEIRAILSASDTKITMEVIN
ncbi:cyclophilin-like fold protein [Streptococcus merionis]|uniref:cyclophilin-like fold protein n=1 Tax=Streptococcus merionis TaxID=400065 RepID=UPI003513C906